MSTVIRGSVACWRSVIHKVIKTEKEATRDGTEKKGISEMPPQAVTLEPLVQGECVVTVLRLLGRTEHAHQPWSATFLWYEISAQGTGPLAWLTSYGMYELKLQWNRASNAEDGYAS
jgi:hypothetical protein